MTLILLKITVQMLIALAALKGIMTIGLTNKVSFADRVGIRLFERNRIAAILWMILAEVMIIQGWAESLVFYKYNSNSDGTAFAVLVLWAWALIMSIWIPSLAGMGGKGYARLTRWVVSAVLMTVTSITVLTLM